MHLQDDDLPLLGRQRCKRLLQSIDLFTANDQFERLAGAARFIGDVQLWQRFAVAEDFDAKAVPERVLRRIAAAVGLPDAKVLKAELDERRAMVRGLFRQILGAAQRG